MIKPFYSCLKQVILMFKNVCYCINRGNVGAVFNFDSFICLRIAVLTMIFPLLMLVKLYLALMLINYHKVKDHIVLPITANYSLIIIRINHCFCAELP